MSVLRLVALVSLLAVASRAGASPPVETEPVVRHANARLVGASVLIDLRVDIMVEGPEPAPGHTHSLALPSGAVITGGTVQAGGQSHRLQLVDKAEADRRLEILYEQPTTSGGRTSAVRIDSDGDTDSATIELAAARRGNVRLDLTLEVPACFADDARNILVPTAWENVVRGGTLVAPQHAEALGERCGKEGPSWLAFPARQLARRAPGEGRVGIRTSRLALGVHDVAQIEISLAKQLTEIPADLHTVVVVDHSRSMTDDELETQRAVIAGYLRAAPNSRIQLVGYTREARTLLPGWMIASQALARIDRELRALVPRNGSNVDRGLAAAATLLRDVHGTRRIVLLTDDRLSDRITTDAGSLALGLPPNILVHVVSLRGSGQRVSRNTGHVLEPLALATKGAALAADLDDHGTIDALPLVRPLSLDDVTITAPGWTELYPDLQCSGDDTFREGMSCRWLGRGSSSSKPIVVEGWLWGTKITRELSPDPRGARSLARQLVTWTGLPSELVEGVQRASAAVNAAFSLLATWGPRGGYGDLESWGSIGLGGVGTSSTHCIGIGQPGPPEPSPAQELIAQLGPAVRACKPTGTISLVVELTREEIVDTSVTLADDRDRALTDCITDNVWDATLVLAAAPRHVTVTVDIPPR